MQIYFGIFLFCFSYRLVAFLNRQMFNINTTVLRRLEYILKWGKLNRYFLFFLRKILFFTMQNDILWRGLDCAAVWRRHSCFDNRKSSCATHSDGIEKIVSKSENLLRVENIFLLPSQGDHKSLITRQISHSNNRCYLFLICINRSIIRALYTTLLFSFFTDPLKVSQNPLGSRSEITHTINWVRSHLEHDEKVSIPKQEVYEDYV